MTRPTKYSTRVTLPIIELIYQILFVSYTESTAELRTSIETRVGEMHFRKKNVRGKMYFRKKNVRKNAPSEEKTFGQKRKKKGRNILPHYYSMNARISLRRDKNKWGKWCLLLLISWCAHDKVPYQSLKFDCKCYITLVSSCLITMWRC